MNFKTLWLELSGTQRKAFARRCKYSVFQLRNVAYGRKASPGLSVAISRESNGLVPIESLNDEVDWEYVRSTKRSKESPPAGRSKSAVSSTA